MNTHNDWFSNNILERLNNSAVDLKININRGLVKNLTFHEAADYTANLIKDIGKPIYVSYSGGLDSEYVVKCFMRNNIPINVVILKTDGNKEELEYAHKFCKGNNLSPIILDVSENEMLKVYYHDIFGKLNGYGENAVASLIVGRYVKEQNGIVVLGEHILDEVDNKISLGVNEWDFYNDAFIDNTYYFFIHTPEILHAMIKDINHTDAQVYKSNLYDLPIRPKMKYDHYSDNYYKALRAIKRQRRVHPNPNFSFGPVDVFIDRHFDNEHIIVSYKKEMHHPHSGFYVYDNEHFFYREDAFDRMLEKKDYYGNIKFYYNDHVFNKIDWSIEPEIDISLLYKMRAQQIRDKYKYVILMLSGGSDSTQVLWSFIKNGIFIDEIQVANLEEMSKNISNKEMLTDNEFKILMEYKLAAFPLLKKVSELSPKTKITIVDASNFLYDQISRGKNIALGDNGRIKHQYPRLASSMGPNLQWYCLFYQKNYEMFSDKDSVCLVRGMEKPNLFIHNNNLFFAFTDQTMVTTALINKGDIPFTYVTEDFFWSKDMPLIPIKQSHIIKRRLETDIQYYNFFTNSKKEIENFARKNIAPIHSPAIMMERSYSRMIYPDWNPNSYAGPKPTNKNPEFKLYERVVGKHKTEEFLKEYRESREKKYENLKNKMQFYKFIYSVPYNLGKLKRNFINV